MLCLFEIDEILIFVDISLFPFNFTNVLSKYISFISSSHVALTSSSCCTYENELTKLCSHVKQRIFANKLVKCLKTSIIVLIKFHVWCLFLRFKLTCVHTFHSLFSGKTALNNFTILPLWGESNLLLLIAMRWTFSLRAVCDEVKDQLHQTWIFRYYLIYFLCVLYNKCIIYVYT